MKYLKLFVLASVLVPVIALADPTGVNIALVCPVSSGSVDALSNYGTYIAGYGQETIDSQAPSFVNYKTTSALSPHTPADLSSYSAQSVNYNSTNGDVTCNYTSSQYPAFSVTHHIVNGRGGSILNTTPNSIDLALPVGLEE